MQVLAARTHDTFVLLSTIRLFFFSISLLASVLVEAFDKVVLLFVLNLISQSNKAFIWVDFFTIADSEREACFARVIDVCFSLSGVSILLSFALNACVLWSVTFALLTIPRYEQQELILL